VAQFRWILLLVGGMIVALVFAYSRGWFAQGFSLPRLFKRNEASADEAAGADDESALEVESESADVAEHASPPRLEADSLVVTVRIMPQPGSRFPAEQLIMTLRAAGLIHGRYGIFHSIDADDPTRIRYSVASLVEPGSFDLTRLSDSDYEGISIFMVLPAPEDGVALFDDMLMTARAVAKGVDGRLVDEQGGALSVQRERYMREEVIEFLRRCQRPADSA
jgi:cell division protein ZipA